MQQPAAHHYSPVALQRILSPLVRSGYGIGAQDAVLMILLTGTVSLVPRDRSGDMTDVQGPRLVWLPPGQTAEIKAGAGTRAELLVLRGTSIMNFLPASPLGEQIHRSLEKPISLPLETPAPFIALLKGLDDERVNNPPGSELAQEHYVGLLLLQVWRVLRLDLIAHGRAPQGLAERFIALAGQHVREHWPVGRYADQLRVTRDRLGSAVRRATGLSPQAYLHQGLVREACELLANTGMPVAQVAFRLGFSDAAYFNRFFSAKTGQSPGRYRRHARARRLKGDTSYAAWP